jgi:hypothetical protein
MVRITNLSAQPIVYTSGADASLRVILKDQNGNYYNRIPSRDQLQLTIDSARTITDTLEFEKPLATGTVLDLDLPVSDKTYQFRIPSTLIGPARPQVAKKQAEVPTQPRVFDPRRERELIADVKAVYNTAMERAQTRMLGMSTNNAARFRKREQDRVIKTLADKLNLTADEIKGMLASK